MKTTAWNCTVGITGDLWHVLPAGADFPMREAVESRFEGLVGMRPEFTFSGWAARLTESEIAVVENRLPDADKVTVQVPYGELVQLVGQQKADEYLRCST